MIYITIEDYNCFKDYIHILMTLLIITDIETSYIFQHITVAIQLIKTALENLLTTEGEVSIFIQPIKDIGGKQNQNTE